MSGFGDSGFGGGDGFGFPPQIVNIVPADLQIERDTVIQFDVIGDIAYAGILASYPDASTEVIHNGQSFSPDFIPSGDVNTVEDTDSGQRFRIRPNHGWAQAPILSPIAIDAFGEMAELPE